MASRLISSLLLLAATVTIAADPAVPRKDSWALPRTDAEKWANRLRTLVPTGWSVSIRENDTIIRRDRPVRKVDGSPGQDIRKPGRPLEPPERPFWLTLRFAPKMSIDDYERLAAINKQSLRQERELAESLKLSWGKGGYTANTPEEKTRLKFYHGEVAKLPWHILPDLYTPDYSIFFYNSNDGWWFIDDKDQSQECAGVEETVRRYFGMYDRQAVLRPKEVHRPKPAWSPKESAPWYGGYLPLGLLRD